MDRHRVWHDSIDYRTSCTRCGAALVRLPSGWTEFEPSRHGDPQRQPHPNDRPEDG
jgi:hypothetical protein